MQVPLDNAQEAWVARNRRGVRVQVIEERGARELASRRLRTDGCTQDTTRSLQVCWRGRLVNCQHYSEQITDGAYRYP